MLLQVMIVLFRQAYFGLRIVVSSTCMVTLDLVNMKAMYPFWAYLLWVLFCGQQTWLISGPEAGFDWMGNVKRNAY
jgi:hypothetical protein